MNKEEIDKIISDYQLRNLGTPEVLECVRKDLEYGISIEQIEQYLKNYNLNSKQKEIYSDCLRKNYPDEFIQLIVGMLDEGQRKVIVSYYDKGMSVDQIKKILEQKPETPAALHKMLQDVYAGLAKYTETACDNEELLLQFQSQIDSIVKRFESQEEKINQMFQTIDEHKNDDYNTEKEQLLKQIADLESDLEREKKASSEQNVTIIKLRNERNGLRVSQNHLKEEIRKRDEALEKEREKVKQLNSQIEKTTVHKTTETEGSAIQEPVLQGVSTVKQSTVKREADAFVIPSDGMKPYVFVKSETPQKEKSSAMALLKKIFLSKKSNRYLMRKVIQMGLDEGQIKQVASGFGKGLTYEQLDILIESKATPEKMAGIIELAVLENSLEMG